MPSHRLAITTTGDRGGSPLRKAPKLAFYMRGGESRLEECLWIPGRRRARDHGRRWAGEGRRVDIDEEVVVFRVQNRHEEAAPSLRVGMSQVAENVLPVEKIEPHDPPPSG